MKKLLSLIFIALCMALTISAHAYADEVSNEKDLKSLTIICETNKDPVYYISGEKAVFTFTVMGDGKPVTVPELRYTLRGDDGTRESGTIKPNSDGKYILEKTCMDIPGFMSLNIDAYGKDGKKWRSHFQNGQSYLFQGGILVNAFAIEAATEEPADFDEFWEASLALLDDYPAELVGLRKLPGTNNLDQYEVYINCYGLESDTKNGDTFVAGYLSVPKNAKPGSLRIQVNYQGQGLGKINAYGGSDRIMFNCLAHSVDLAELAELSDSGMSREDMMKQLLNLAPDDKSTWNSPMYGMSPKVNADREKVYYRQMLLRDYQAIEFLIKYFSESSTATEFDGIDISAWAGLWDGENIKVEGGSQGGFQAIGVAALHRSVSELSAVIPWLCSIGAGTNNNPVGTYIGSGNRPEYAAGLDYVDTVFLAKRVTCKTTVKAGLGDPTCPPSGTMAMFNNLVNGKNIDVTFELKQNRNHGYNPEDAHTTVLKGEFSGVTGWTVENGVLIVGGTGVLDTSLPEVEEWNKQISEVKEIKISGAFTHIGEGVFELEAPVDVYIYCQLDFDSRAFGGQEIRIFVPVGVKIEGAISLGILSKNGAFLYSTQDGALVLKSAAEDAVLDLSELDLDFRAFVSENSELITSVEIRGKFAAIGRLKDSIEDLPNCRSVKIDVLCDTLTSKQNFSRIEALDTLGHWDFEKNEPVTYTEGTVDLTGFKKLAEGPFTLPEAMFEGCKAIKRVILPAELICGDTLVSGRISKSFFKNCESLEVIEIPESITLQSIGYGALKGCRALKTVNINGTVSQTLSIEFELAGVGCFNDLPADCRFICRDRESAQKLADLFLGASVNVISATSDGKTVAGNASSADTNEAAGNAGDDKPSESTPIIIIAAAIAAVLAVGAVVAVVVIKKKKK